jgi:nicotinate-nucleotide adenylyltransferase
VQWRLLVGADVLHDIQRWHKFDQLCALAPLLVLGRAGVSDVAAPPPVLPLVSSSEVRKLLADYAQKPNTETREQLARLLPKAVLDHIHQAHLYGVF